jgi:protein ImuA
MPAGALAGAPLPAPAWACDPRPALRPESLHPALWRAAQLGRATGAGLPTGFPALDAELPGGGWPRQALTELLLPHPGVGEWRLLAPVLAALQRGDDPVSPASPGSPGSRAGSRGPGVPGALGAPGGHAGRGGIGADVPRPVMLFDPPARPCAWTLAALGLDLSQLVIVQGRAQPRGRSRMGAALPAMDTLWALEQALSSGQVGAVLAWLPARLRGDALRRLQLAAQAHAGPVFLFREIEARLKPSAAPLRLQLAAGIPDQLLLRIVKRRGPPRTEPLALALPPVLSAAARERALAPRRVLQSPETVPA